MAFHSLGRSTGNQLEIFTGSSTTGVEAIDCPSNCARRCSKARHNVCNRACLACCHHCNCVPPGTSGNKELCPCYANLMKRKGRPKCP
ncbi:hypothetical protein KFK09_000586 [Dendrobium nobile]|uniref:Uncharacterized protein n=1 Tax=Dendrobium nobile TaxID=94219 RepID=A0A8T3CDI7_DENNO|nr:hypothetical protein KFK09_000586 [Dendrobium nobile]